MMFSVFQAQYPHPCQIFKTIVSSFHKKSTMILMLYRSHRIFSLNGLAEISNNFQGGAMLMEYDPAYKDGIGLGKIIYGWADIPGQFLLFIFELVNVSQMVLL